MQSIFKTLWFQVLVALLLGITFGLLLAPTGAGLLSEAISEQIAPWIALPGNLFLSMIRMVVIPLVLASIILGITSSEDTAFLKNEPSVGRDQRLRHIKEIFNSMMIY